MKKMLICLLTMLMLIPAAMAEEERPIKLEMELSQMVFDGPQEVDVTIVVTNVSGEDMTGPMALYTPDGMMVKEFGTPTLKAGESQTWQGTWNVTEQQLDAGKVVFAVMYYYQKTDGSMERKIQSYYSQVAWSEKPPQSVEIVLKGNPSTGYSWEWECVSGNGHIDIVNEMTTTPSDNPALLGGAEKYTYVVTGVEPGDVEVCFTYARPWEDDPTMAVYKLYYDIHVDEELNVSILNTRFDW